MTCNLIKTINVKNILGECILWDAVSGSTWWTDIHAATLYRYFPDSEEIRRYAMPERLCSFGFVLDDHRLICAFESGFAIYDPETGSVDWIDRPEKDIKATRFNDGRVDRQGRFWSGTMAEGDATDMEGKPVTGSLYCTDSEKTLKVLDGIAIPNSLCWSVDSRTMYFTDSPGREIFACDFNPDDGSPGDKKVFARTTGESQPDGSIIDADGYLWNAHWGGGKVVRYTPEGKIDYEIVLPVTQPTCICFGGEGLNFLFVSSARENLSDEQLLSQPHAGSVFIYETRYHGLDESRFVLKK